MMVVHVKTEFRSDLDDDAGRTGARTRQMMESTGTGLLRGSRTADIPPELTPAPSDVVVIKTRFSGFWSTSLNEALKNRDIELHPGHEPRAARVGAGTNRNVLWLGLRLD